MEQYIMNATGDYLDWRHPLARQFAMSLCLFVMVLLLVSSLFGVGPSILCLLVVCALCSLSGWVTNDQPGPPPRVVVVPRSTGPGN